MLLSSDARDIAATIRDQYQPIRKHVHDAFKQAVLGAPTERHFLAQIGPALTKRLSGAFYAGLLFTVRSANIDRKPQVRTDSYACELGDLLVTVKYLTPNAPTEKKSLIYQVKMAGKSSGKCKIDRNQLDLLTNWPTFNFGKMGSGYRTFDLHPNTLEFGSFMLEPRSAQSGQTLNRVHPNYGIALPAVLIDESGQRNIPLDIPLYARGDGQNMFSHIAFEIGEHHNISRPIDDLVESVYRYVGLQPDPPDEFDGFMGNNGGYTVVEVTVGPEEAF